MMCGALEKSRFTKARDAAEVWIGLRCVGGGGWCRQGGCRGRPPLGGCARGGRPWCRQGVCVAYAVAWTKSQVSKQVLVEGEASGMSGD